MTDVVELNINSSKKAEIEFDVHIQGIKSDEQMKVRFVLKHSAAHGDLLFACTHVDGDKWRVNFPTLKTVIKAASCEFVLEVIIDGYYFTPVEGKVNFISTPTVDMTKKRPTVEASFIVKQDVDIVEERTAQAAGDISDSSAPTTALLTPEFEPSGVPMPGDLPEEDEEDEETGVKEVTESFDASKIASTIIKSTFGNVQQPATKGFLFNRTGSGKPTIRGLEDKATRQQLDEKEAKVREILAGK